MSHVRTSTHRSLIYAIFMSPGSSAMVIASHRRSGGCGFDSRLGLETFFSEFARIKLEQKTVHLCL